MSERELPGRILLVTGLSGAGRTTALKTLEDLGWEVVDNLPLALLDRLLGAPAALGGGDQPRPLALGIDSRTRGFDAAGIVARAERLRKGGAALEILFLDCASAELARRFSETRRRHPLALDRPAADGIERERELTDPLRRAASHLIDTTELSANALQGELRRRFGGEGSVPPTLVVTSFGFARGLPRSADLVLDMRFLRNPHWEPLLRPLPGTDARVAGYIAGDPVYAQAMAQIEALLETLLPRYAAEGKTYVTIAFGCTGGRHRSVHVAERIAARLRGAGFSPTLTHRDLVERPGDSAGGSESGSGAAAGVRNVG